jgi:hypothetical protein
MANESTKTVKRMTRAQIKETLDKTPIEHILGTKQPLTNKQREFARKVALGTMSKRQSYKETYNTTSEHSLNSNPYVMMRDTRIQREIEAYRLAIEAEKQRNPAQLKALLVQQLVQHSLDSEFPPAQRMKALELIGKLYEVGAFVELKETTVINKKAVDIKAQLIERIKEVIDVDAKPDRSGAKSLQEEIDSGESEHADPTAGPPPVEQADAGSPNAYYSTQTNIQENEN